MNSPFDPTNPENWKFHDEYEFWYIPFPEKREMRGLHWYDPTRERGFFPWEHAKEYTRTPIVNAPVGDEYDIVLAKDAIEVAKENNLAVAKINVFVLERIITAQAYSQPCTIKSALFYAPPRATDEGEE